MPNRNVLPPTALLSLLVLAACGARTWDPTIATLETLPPADGERFLRAHLQSGGMVVLSRWEPVPVDGALAGFGTRLGPSNDTLTTGELRVPLDSVVLWATEDPTRMARFPMAGLVTWTSLSGLVTLVCLADPKGCFGSCPTFYLEGDAGDRLVAEGFSSSFARVLEASDVDALPASAAADNGSRVSLVMRNEAPETHAVRSVRLLAVAKPPEGEIVPTARGAFRIARDALPPTSCHAPDRPSAVDCRPDLSRADGREYLSPADSTDLAARELVTVDFDVPPTDPGEGEPGFGLVLRARNSLLSTYVFYQTIAYLGSRAEHWLAELERGDPVFRERALGLARELGDIEVMLERSGRWEVVGRYDEAGPIASDVRLIPLGEMPPGRARVALRMARGNWRIDRLSLVRLGAAVRPTPLDPVSVEPLSGGLSAEEARARLTDPDEYLVTHRGDAYRLTWDLSGPASERQLFLRTRGYYYEWMRPEWLAEENVAMAALIFADPSSALRRMAPAFKSREVRMEESFWSSRFRRDDP